MRVLFVIRAVEHYYYFKSIVDALCARGHRVRVLFDRNFSQRGLGEIKSARNDDCQYSWGAWQDSSWRQIFWRAADLLSWRRYFEVRRQSDFYRKRWEMYLPFKSLLKLPFAAQILRGDLSASFLRFLVKNTPTDRRILEDIGRNSCDVVVASPANMPFSSCDVEYLRAAKKLRIPTVLPVFSWDNLTTKGLIHVKPDLMLVWSQTQQKEALEHHGIKKSDTRIIGSPMFDFWFEKREPSGSRADFCAKFGLDRSLPILLYLESSNSLTRDERWLVKKLHKLLLPIQIIVRPHPFLSAFEDFHFASVKVIPPKGEWLNSERAIQLYFDTFHWCDVVFGINTSGLIDAAILDKPALSAKISQYRETQVNTLHFKQLLANDVIEMVDSFEGLIRVISNILAGRDKHQEQRARFVKEFIRPKGANVSAGEAAATEIEKKIASPSLRSGSQ